MKICYLCADPGIAFTKFNGSAKHVQSVVRAFAELGHEVTLVMSSVEGSKELDVPVVPIAAPAVSEDILSFTLGGNAAKKPMRPVARALRHICRNVTVEAALERVFDQRRPDFVYERYSPFSAAGGLFCERANVAHVLEVNAPLAWEGVRHRAQGLAEAAMLLEDTALQAASMVVTVSHELRELLMASGVDGSKVEVVFNGVDTGTFNPDGAVFPIASEDRFVIGFVGSLKPWHGVDVLADAFRRLAGEDRRYHLLIVGDGPLAKELDRLEGELPGRVTFARSVAPGDVPAYIRAMDVALAPYPPLEPFYFSPLKVLEYMACGRPVVASAIGQLCALIDHDSTGLLVPPGDVDALSAAIRRLASNQQLRWSMGKRASLVAKRRHAWANRAAHIVECAKLLAEQRTARGVSSAEHVD